MCVHEVMDGSEEILYPLRVGVRVNESVCV